MTLTDPSPHQHRANLGQDTWMTLGDRHSRQHALDRVRAQPGRVAVWVTEVPTRFTAEQESVLWEVALRARTLVVPSRCALARVLASGVVHPASVAVVPLPTRLEGPVDSGVATPGAGPLVVTPTALDPLERVDVVLDALASLARSGLQVRYHVVVDPAAHRHARSWHPSSHPVDALSRWDGWQARAERLGLGGQVQWSLDTDPVAVMATAQTVVLPWESDDLVASQTLIDAMTLGVPVVASAFPHAVELAPTGAVTLWRADSPQALERTLYRVLTRPLLRTAMRHAARQAARTHAPEVVRERRQQLALDVPRGHW